MALASNSKLESGLQDTNANNNNRFIASVESSEEEISDMDIMMTEGKIQAVMENAIIQKQTEIKNILVEIDKLDEQIAQRSDERFSSDMEKGEGSSDLSASSQLITLAYEIVRELESNKAVTVKDLDETILSLQNIKKALLKLNK